MGYTPKNTPVYLRALIGFMSGISGNDVTDTNASQVGSYAAMADAYAQEVDQVYGANPFTTTFLGVIEEASEATWRSKSVLEAANAFKPGSYLQIAQSVIAKATQANAQVVSEGVDPNNTGGGSGSSTPLTHGRWIDGSTATALATQNGFIGTPYGAIQTWLNNLPASASASDSQAIQVGFLTGNAQNLYTENPVIPAYRSIELHGMQGFMAISGNFTCTNTHAAAGATPAPPSVFHIFKNLLAEGLYTITDDGTVTSVAVFEADGEVESEIVSVVATGATFFVDCIAQNEVIGSLTSTANSLGAVVFVEANASLGNATCNSIQANWCDLFGTAYTVAAGTTSNLVFTEFTGTNPVITGGAGTIITMDQTTYQSFVSAGGTLAGGAAFLIVPYSGFLAVPQRALAGANVIGGPGLTNNNIFYDTTGANVNYTFNPTPVPGEMFRAKARGSGQATLVLTPAGAFGVEDPSNPGTFSSVAAVHFAGGNGGSITYQFISFGGGIGNWIIVATV